MTKEVLTLALEALKYSDTVFYPQTKIAIAAIERALANHIEDNLVMVQEPVAYDKTEMNGFVQDLYDKKMQEGKHGHYETMFHVVHQAIKRVSPPAPQQHTWVGLTDREFEEVTHGMEDLEDCWIAIEAKLKEKNT
jgi:hypothetical protein